MTLIDGARRARLNALESRLRTLQTDAARMLWDLGSLLREIVDDELWREGGHVDFDAWADATLGTSGRTARRAIEIARHYSRAMAERFGTEKLLATLRYLEVTRSEELPGDALSLEFRIRGDRGRFQVVPFVDASVRQITEATRLIEERRLEIAKDRAAPAGDVAAKVKRLGDAFPATKVAAKRRRDGRVVYSFRDVAEDEVEGFLAAARQHLLG